MAWWIVHAAAVLEVTRMNDVLDGVRSVHGDAPWPVAAAPAPDQTLRTALSWSGPLLVWCWVCWSVTCQAGSRAGRHLPTLVAVTAVALPTVVSGLALLPVEWAGAVHGLTWPGPIGVLLSPDVAASLAQPAVLGPALAVAALAYTGRAADRVAGGSPSTRAPERRHRATAAVLVAVPAGTAWVGAVVALVAAAPDEDPLWQSGLTVLLGDGGLLLLVALAAALASGGGRASLLPVATAHVLVVGGVVVRWAQGDSDVLLLVAALGTAATACALAWRPAARALEGLSAPAPPVPMAP
jgi:hypothetical protein